MAPKETRTITSVGPITTNPDASNKRIVQTKEGPVLVEVDQVFEVRKGGTITVDVEEKSKKK